MTWWNLYSRCFKCRLSHYLKDSVSRETRTVLFLLFYERFLLLVLSLCFNTEAFFGRMALRLFLSAPQFFCCCLKAIFLLLTHSLCPVSFTFLWKHIGSELLVFVNSFPNIFAAVICPFLIYKRQLSPLQSSVSCLWELLFSQIKILDLQDAVNTQSFRFHVGVF